MTDAVSMLCRTCADVGCECPRGYFAGKKRCDVCRFTFVLSAAGCQVASVRCPRCGGSIDDPEDA